MARATYAPQSRTSYYTQYIPPPIPPDPPVSGASAWGYAIEKATSGVSVAPRDHLAALDTTYGAVFSSYTDMGNTIRFTYNTTAWPTRVTWLNINNIASIVGTKIHNGSVSGGRSRAVALTRRHVITSQHGGPNTDAYPYMVWPGYANGYSPVVRRCDSGRSVAWVGANKTASPEGGSAAGDYWGPHQGFHVYLLDSDLPDYMVCAIPSPTTAPSLAGRPAFTVNQQSEFAIFQVYSDYDPRLEYVINADVEMLSNPEFASDISGWTDASSGWAWNSSYGGVARHAAAAAKALTQSVYLAPNQRYVIKVRVAAETVRGIYGVRVTVGSRTISAKTNYTWSTNGLHVGEYVGTFVTGSTAEANTVTIWPYSDWVGDVASVSIKPLYHGELRQGVFLERPSSPTLNQWWRQSIGGDSGSPILTSYTNSSGQHRPVWLGGLCTAESDHNLPVDSNGDAVSDNLKKVTIPNIFLSQFNSAIFAACNKLSEENGLNKAAYQPKFVSDGYWYS